MEVNRPARMNVFQVEKTERNAKLIHITAMINIQNVLHKYFEIIQGCARCYLYKKVLYIKGFHTKEIQIPVDRLQFKIF